MRRHYLNIIFFLLCLFLLGSINLFWPHKPEVSELENRALKEKPVLSLAKVLTGEFTRDYDDYISDTFVYRDFFVRLSGKIRALGGLPSKDKVTLIKHGGANVGDKQGKVEVGSMLVLNDKAMEVHNFNSRASEYYAGSINGFVKGLNKGIKVYSLLVPTQIEFIDHGAKGISAPQNETIDFVNNLLDERVIPVNAYNLLKQKKDEYIYFRSDHHWTALGAYYAYTAFMDNRGGEKAIPLEQYTKEQVDSFLGRTYAATLSEEVRDNPDTVYLYKTPQKYKYFVFYEKPYEMSLLDMSYVDCRNKYGIFLGGDHPLSRIRTEKKNGRKIIVIKDSYGNAFIPFLLPHYEEIYVVDPRQYKDDIFSVIGEQGIDEVLFLNYVLVTDNEDYSNLISELNNRKPSEK